LSKNALLDSALRDSLGFIRAIVYLSTYLYEKHKIVYLSNYLLI